MVSTRNRKNDSPPRQNVYANLTACWRTRTGWMCRKTLFMTAYARERSSRGYGWRKSDRQTALRRIAASTRSRNVIGASSVRASQPDVKGQARHRAVRRVARSTAGKPWVSARIQDAVMADQPGDRSRTDAQRAG